MLCEPNFTSQRERQNGAERQNEHDLGRLRQFQVSHNGKPAAEFLAPTHFRTVDHTGDRSATVRAARTDATPFRNAAFAKKLFDPREQVSSAIATT